MCRMRCAPTWAARRGSNSAARRVDALPLSLKLAGERCVVVGGGAVAARKIELLLTAGAALRVVAAEPSAAVRDICSAHGCELLERRFRPADVHGALLAIAATDEARANDAVARACRRRGVLVNCVDDLERSTALFPAIVDRSPVTVAISTGGASPTLARRLRERIEAVLPSRLGALASFLRAHRQSIKDALPDVRSRQRFWDRALDGDLAAVLGSDAAAAESALRAALEAPARTGFVSLVGGGPGDPDLLTMKALQCLQRADIVYYDNLVGKGVLERCRRDAERVYVGRRAWHRGTHADVRQADINARLVADAERGLRVVRLKGGDPLIFSRGGEEVAALAAADVPFEVVPGVTAAAGCAAIAGIPLTHRDWAQSVRFVTGHRRHGVHNLDWPELARPGQTLVVYMGLGALGTVTQELVRHGADPATPAATISRGSLPEQRVVKGTLADLTARVAAAGVEGPATTIVGRVAALGR